MRASCPSLAFILAVAIISACSKPPDISGDLEEYGTLLNDVTSARCVCFADLGYADGEACIDDLGLVTAFDNDCLANVSSGYEEDVREHLKCANSALEEYVSCLVLNDDCAEGAHDDCEDLYESQIASCPQLPSSIRTSFAACTE